MFFFSCSPTTIISTAIICLPLFFFFSSLLRNRHRYIDLFRRRGNSVQTSELCRHSVSYCHNNLHLWQLYVRVQPTAHEQLDVVRLFFDNAISQ